MTCEGASCEQITSSGNGEVPKWCSSILRARCTYAKRRSMVHRFLDGTSDRVNLAERLPGFYGQEPEITKDHSRSTQWLPVRAALKLIHSPEAVRNESESLSAHTRRRWSCICHNIYHPAHSHPSIGAAKEPRVPVKLSAGTTYQTRICPVLAAVANTGEPCFAVFRTWVSRRWCSIDAPDGSLGKSLRAPLLRPVQLSSSSRGDYESLNAVIAPSEIHARFRDWVRRFPRRKVRVYPQWRPTQAGYPSEQRGIATTCSYMGRLSRREGHRNNWLAAHAATRRPDQLLVAGTGPSRGGNCTLATERRISTRHSCRAPAPRGTRIDNASGGGHSLRTATRIVRCLRARGIWHMASRWWRVASPPTPPVSEDPRMDRGRRNLSPFYSLRVYQDELRERPF
jgi:hypothetical protein